MRLGEVQDLAIVKEVEFGVYLGDGDERVLLPKKQVPKGSRMGDVLSVFLYRDSADRLIATTRTPAVTLGGLSYLPVKEVGKNGAFLDWGLEKDLFLPYKEQTVRVRPGSSYLIALYIDRSDRLCATMKVHAYLRSDPDLKKEEHITGTVYGISQTAGAFVAVENRYMGLIPKKELTSPVHVGDVIHGRVSEVKPDGKLSISLHERVEFQMDIDAAAIMDKLEKAGGVLFLTDKSAPETIREQLAMSKAAFKRAAGRLMKQGRVRMDEKCLKIIQDKV